MYTGTCIWNVKCFPWKGFSIILLCHFLKEYRHRVILLNFYWLSVVALASYPPPPPPPSLSLSLSLHPLLLNINADEVGNFIEESPRVDGGRISVRIKFSVLVQSALCSLTGQPTQDCKLFVDFHFFV